MTILEEKALEFADEVILGEDEEAVGFYCPTCGEPIYFEDWDNRETGNWLRCPICMGYFDGSDEDF